MNYCFSPDGLCGCCCELCHPVRCVIDQHEVEIIPATYRSSSSMSSTAHGGHGSDTGSLPSTYRSACAPSSHRSQTDDVPTSRSTAVSSHRYQTASRGDYRISPSHSRTRRGGQPTAHGRRKVRGGGGTVKLSHFYPNAYPHAHTASSTGQNEASRDFLGGYKPFLLFEDSPKHAACRPSTAPLSFEQLQEHTDRANDPRAVDGAKRPMPCEGSAIQSDWRICSDCNAESSPASPQSPDRQDRLQPVPSLNIELLLHRRASLADRSPAPPANEFASSTNRIGDDGVAMMKDPAESPVLAGEIPSSAAPLALSSQAGQTHLSAAVAALSPGAEEEELPSGSCQADPTAEGVDATCSETGETDRIARSPRAVLAPSRNHSSRMTNSERRLQSAVTKEDSLFDRNVDAPELRRGRIRQGSSETSSAAPRSSVVASSPFISSRILPVSRSARQIPVIDTEVSLTRFSPRGAESDVGSTKTAISRQRVAMEFSPGVGERLVGERASAEREVDHLRKEERMDRLPKCQNSNATGAVALSDVEHLERVDRNYETFPRELSRVRSPDDLHRFHHDQEAPLEAGFSGQSLSRQFTQTVSLSSHSLQSSQSLSSRESSSVWSSSGGSFGQLSSRGSFSSSSSVLSRGAFSVVAESNDIVGQPQKCVRRSGAFATARNHALPRIPQERRSSLSECGSSVQVLQRFEREQAPRVAVLRYQPAPVSAASPQRRTAVLYSAAPPIPRPQKTLSHGLHGRKQELHATGLRLTSGARSDSNNSSPSPFLSLWTPPRVSASGAGESAVTAVPVSANTRRSEGGEVHFRRFCSDVEVPNTPSNAGLDGALSEDRYPQRGAVPLAFLPPRFQRSQRAGSVASAWKPGAGDGKARIFSRDANGSAQKSTKEERKSGSPPSGGAQLSAGARLVFWASSRSHSDGRAS
ncbi:conserved hypothetical protein [Neospora caninum Liverpool]|uniref:Uncharacterized protein n=1 Tax=Neospora caninum (strain Liverpool) TaxID=572307 RepID=F0VEY6_NEOCL|nr:conserved hypothetical protein [Neospora caninum Liverpool]CBZ52280.1 conserved hypothetical protein [Neospora caninum Liverpool]CEL66248.1 TPA: hypothetical protein BN1204_020670 [Neospora caninum Liverpool]|eukprot:XP_003882312.1 conserved hypothetical protein [Neospora caninum Liverpool]